MAEIMIKAAGLVFVIIIAFILKQVHVLEKRDGLTIATIIMNVTLPCALLTNASGVTIDQSMLILLLIGLASNIIMLFISFILSRKEENILNIFLFLIAKIYSIMYNIKCKTKVKRRDKFEFNSKRNIRMGILYYNSVSISNGI